VLALWSSTKELSGCTLAGTVARTKPVPERCFQALSLVGAQQASQQEWLLKGWKMVVRRPGSGALEAYASHREESCFLVLAASTYH
jgi:hypothetical protein